MGQEDILWKGRFRSARKKKQLVIEDFDKYLLRLGRERKALRKQKWNLGYEPLEPPVQKGFKRLFVLRDDVARSPRAAFFAEILEVINTVQYSDTRQFSRRRRHRGRKIKVARPQELMPVYALEWKRLQLTLTQACYFSEVLELGPSREWRRVYRFTEPWRFRLKVVPNVITEVRIKDFALERRMDEIGNYLEQDNREARLQKLQHGYTRYFSYADQETPKYRDLLKNVPLPQVLEMARLDALQEDPGF